MDNLSRHADDRSIVYENIDEALGLIRSKFKMSFPWMYVFALYKDTTMRRVFYAMRSFPLNSLVALPDTHHEGYQVLMTAQWRGDNKDDFYEQMKKEEKKEEKPVKTVSWESEEWDIQKAKPVYASPNSLTEALHQLDYAQRREFDNCYPANMTIKMDDVNHIFIYDWGFEISTNTPLDFICIKRQALAKVTMNAGTPVNQWQMQSSSENAKVRAMLEGGTDFVLPSECCNIRTLRACWHQKTRTKHMEDIDKMLNPKKSFMDDEDSPNAGQEVNPNILL